MRLRKFGVIVGMGLLAGAILQELRKPKGQREWHGSVAGIVPYDFRAPTLDRMRAAWWNPDEEHLFTPQVIGVGWTVNVGRLVRLARSRRSGPDGRKA